MKNQKICRDFRFHPAVFVWEDCYRIMTWVQHDMLFWIEVGGNTYHDAALGVLRSACTVHKVTVPMAELDAACGYTVHYRRISDRTPYTAQTGEEQSVFYPFRPVRTNQTVYAYQITDAHEKTEAAIRAGSYFGEKLSLLLLTGDIANHSQTPEQYAFSFAIASALGGGEIPVLYTRGNHDGRGQAAELFDEFTPFDRDRAYFSFVLGPLSGIVVDCGEDKPDDHAEYSKTVCFAAYRERQEAYLSSLCLSLSAKTLAAPHRLLFSHTPFTYTKCPPYDIEVERYTRWIRLLEDAFQPELLIAGHLHQAQVSEIGGALDCKGQTCPVVIGATSTHSTNPFEDFIGTAYTFSSDHTQIDFTNGEHQITDSYVLPRRAFMNSPNGG